MGKIGEEGMIKLISFQKEFISLIESGQKTVTRRIKRILNIFKREYWYYISKTMGRFSYFIGRLSEKAALQYCYWFNYSRYNLKDKK